MERNDFSTKNRQEVNDVNKLIDDAMANKYIDNKSKSQLYNRIKSIIDHDHWYSKEDIEQLYNKAQKCLFFTYKQKKSLEYSSLIERESDEDIDYSYNRHPSWDWGND